MHLGSRQSGGAAPAFGAEEDAFARLIDLALEISVDGLLIAGDLFDSARVGEAVVEWTATQLNRLYCETVVLPGNHDALLPGSPYELHDFAARCNATTVISDHGGELVTLLDGRLVVWGRPVVDHAPWFRPLDGVPARPRDCFAVVVAHGLFVDGDEAETVRGSPIYARELELLDWDYVALGHWPRYREVCDAPLAIYPGELAPGPRHRGGAVIVSCKNGSVSSRRRCF